MIFCKACKMMFLVVLLLVSSAVIGEAFSPTLRPLPRNSALHSTSTDSRFILEEQSELEIIVDEAREHCLPLVGMTIVKADLKEEELSLTCRNKTHEATFSSGWLVFDTTFSDRSTTMETTVQTYNDTQAQFEMQAAYPDQKSMEEFYGYRFQWKSPRQTLGEPIFISYRLIGRKIKAAYISGHLDERYESLSFLIETLDGLWLKCRTDSDFELYYEREWQEYALWDAAQAVSDYTRPAFVSRDDLLLDCTKSLHPLTRMKAERISAEKALIGLQGRIIQSLQVMEVYNQTTGEWLADPILPIRIQCWDNTTFTFSWYQNNNLPAIAVCETSVPGHGIVSAGDFTLGEFLKEHPLFDRSTKWNHGAVLKGGDVRWRHQKFFEVHKSNRKVPGSFEECPTSKYLLEAYHLQEAYHHLEPYYLMTAYKFGFGYFSTCSRAFGRLIERASLTADSLELHIGDTLRLSISPWYTLSYECTNKLQVVKYVVLG